MKKKTQIYVENRSTWKEEYGTFIVRLDKTSFDIKTINKIFSIEKIPLSILDAGCSYGYHLKLLKCINPSLKLYGLEISKDALKLTKKMNIAQVYNQSISDKFNFKENEFDLIYSMDVIEHLKNKEELIKFLAESSRVLKKEGVIIIKTPAMNLTSLIAAMFSFNLSKYFCTDHTLPLNYKRIKELIPPSLEIKKVFYTENKDNKLINTICNLFKMHHIWVILKKK